MLLCGESRWQEFYHREPRTLAPGNWRFYLHIFREEHCEKFICLEPWDGVK